MNDSIISVAIIKVIGVTRFYKQKTTIGYYKSGGLSKITFETNSVNPISDSIRGEEVINEVYFLDTINSIYFDSTKKQINWNEY